MTDKAEVIRSPDDLPEATQHTIAALMDEVSTNKCTLAGMQLGSFVTLNLASQEISDLVPLADMKNLQFLILHDNQITDLSPLAGLTNLRVLYLGVNRIRDLDLLAGLTNLTQLYMGSNQIQDLRPLSGLVNLEILSLRANQISNITPLRSLQNLHTLYLESNRISGANNTVSMLFAMPNLSRLYFSNNPLSRRVCPNRPEMVCFI